VGTPVTRTGPSASSWLAMLVKALVLPWLSLRYSNFSRSGRLAVKPAAASMDLARPGLYGYGS
jgi:hypothetical protein